MGGDINNRGLDIRFHVYIHHNTYINNFADASIHNQRAALHTYHIRNAVQTDPADTYIDRKPVR